MSQRPAKLPWGARSVRAGSGPHHRALPIAAGEPVLSTWARCAEGVGSAQMLITHFPSLKGHTSLLGLLASS